MTFKGINDKQIRDSGMALSLICLIITLWFEKDLFLLLTMAALVVTMTIPIIFKPFAFIWINLSRYIGIVISKGLLTVIFFGLVIPIGAILKMIGKDSMYTRKWKDGNSTSVMIKRDHIYTSKDLNNPF